MLAAQSGLWWRKVWGADGEFEPHRQHPETGTWVMEEMSLFGRETVTEDRAARIGGRSPSWVHPPLL